MKVDEIAIILEDIRGKFDLVLEGHEALKSYIDRRYEALGRKIDKNTFLIGALNSKIDSLGSNSQANSLSFTLRAREGNG